MGEVRLTFELGLECAFKSYTAVCSRNFFFFLLC